MNQTIEAYTAMLTAQDYAGSWLFDKFARQVKRRGLKQTAINCRKQGVPLEVTLKMLRAL